MVGCSVVIMIRWPLAAIALMAWAPAAVPREQPPLILGPSGYGLVVFGQPLAVAERALGRGSDGRRLNPACDVVAFRPYPGVRFMVENGVITRADLQNLQLPKSTGITARMSLDEIRRRHPDATIQPHKYDPKGHTIVIRTTGQPRAVVFEESQGRITRIRAGLQPAVEYVEGCG
jgi:hypothetical protein